MLCLVVSMSIKICCPSCDIAAHVCDLQHFLSVNLDLIHLVSMGPVDRLHLLAKVILPWVEMLEVREWSLVAGVSTMRICREQFRKSVPHLDLPVERSVEVGWSRIKAAIFFGTFSCWWQSIVVVVVQESCLIIERVAGSRGCIKLVEFVLLNESLCCAHRHIIILNAFSLSRTAPSHRRNHTITLADFITRAVMQQVTAPISNL